MTLKQLTVWFAVKKVQWVFILAGLLLLSGCVSAPVSQSKNNALADRWGIEVASLHLSANGRMVDFRYRVLDPDKATLLGDRNVKPTLIDLATGAVLRVPSFPKTGSLRQTSTKLETGKIYFMIFSNTGMTVKSGSRVTIVIGDFRAENLVVQ